nr:RNA-directed DNA polymerase, eukaryota [Tanacetum cinerariifolium]
MEENDEEEQNDDGGFNVHESGSCGGDSDVEGTWKQYLRRVGRKKTTWMRNIRISRRIIREIHLAYTSCSRRKKDNVEKKNNSEHSMKYPPSFTPKEGTDVVGMHAEESRSDNIVNLSDHNAEEVNNTFSGNCPKKNSKEDVSNLVCSGHFKTLMVPRTGGSILSLMDELVKVWQVMGYKMDECMSNMTETIESQGVTEMLWDYLTYEIGKWKGEVVIMGDFNKVRYKSDRISASLEHANFECLNDNAQDREDSEKVNCAASKLECLILKTPFSYLGSKVEGSMSRVHTWNEMVDRVTNRLSKWKMKTLSIGDRMVIKQFFERIFGLKTSLDSSFHRVPRGRVEQEQFYELSALVHDVTLTHMSDRWIRALESLGDFCVASVRKVIDDKSLPEVDSKTRWIKYVPIKVNVHACKVKTDSLPTRFNVSRRIIHIDSIMCAICDKGAETSSHLFFSCCMARQTIRMITRWLDAPYGEVDSYEDWINHVENKEYMLHRWSL